MKKERTLTMTMRSSVLRCLVGFSLASAGPAAYAEVFTFAWPAPGVVRVDAKMAKKGNTSTARYSVALNATGENDYSLEFRDFEFISLNGKDAQDPKIAAQLGPVSALTASLPSMLISRDGNYLGTFGIEQTMERLMGLMPKKFDESTRRRMGEYLRSPQVQAMMQQKSGEVWNAWVGAWNGLDLEAGQKLRGRVPVKLMNRDLEQSVLVEHLGPISGEGAALCPQCVRLRLTTIVEGPEVLQVVSGMLRELGSRDPSELQFVSARSMNVTEAVTDPGTLMPRFVVSNTEVTLRDAAEQTRSQHDRKEYHFDW